MREQDGLSAVSAAYLTVLIVADDHVGKIDLSPGYGTWIKRGGGLPA